MRKSKTLLLAGISAAALQLAASQVFAADVAVKAPPPPPAPTPPLWTWWVEGGGASLTGGDPFIPSFTPPFEVMPRRWGFQGAAGADYRMAASPWHLSADFRYMSNGTGQASSLQTATFVGPGAAIGPNSGNRKEHSWEADFMVGRDVGIGSTAQIKGGLRIADLWGQSNGQVAWAFIPSGTQTRGYQQTDHFFGVGPRLAIEGSAPLGGNWSFDYNGGIAGLWGRSTANQTISVAGTFGGGGFACTSGCPIAISANSDNFIFNADGQVGIAYAFDPHNRVSLNYRAEYFGKVLESFNAAGNPARLDRTNQGPTLKWTFTY